MMKASQTVLTRVGAISFYTTAKHCREGVGNSQDVNKAVYLAYWALEDSRKMTDSNGGRTSGVVGNWNGLNIQIDVVAKEGA